MADPAASTYAGALYEAATEADRLDAVRRDLAALVQALATDPKLARVIFNPSIDTEVKRRVVAQIGVGGDDLVVKFVHVLLANGRIGLLPDAAAAFQERYEREQRELAVILTTAVAIDDATADALRGRLEEATGQRITLRRVVDPEILGGVILRMRDRLVDASVRRRLEALRHDLVTVRLPV